MSSKIYSVEVHGLDGQLVEIEADSRYGMVSFVVVGLPDAAVQEARERVRSAIRNSGFEFPRGRVVVNLAPADLRKVGPRYDLSIAIGIVALSGEFSDIAYQDTVFLGELALNGNLRSIAGVLASVEFAKKQGFKKVILPQENAAEAALISDIEIIPVKTLSNAVAYLSGNFSPEPVSPFVFKDEIKHTVDMATIKGQIQAKRALEIAAAGGHNILFNGSPGAGKTLMANALSGILPKMTQDEMLEVTKIYSVAGLLPKDKPLIISRPFRPIHHTASAVSVVGGGNIPAPGEITLAHRGVLFMDEVAEFPKNVLEVLRQPMEDSKITVSRARGTVTYPAKFIFVAAMNPCPCGYFNVENAKKSCTCSAIQIHRYQKKLSGPLLDRIDMHLNIQPVNYSELTDTELSESSEIVRERVEKAVEIQKNRLSSFGIHFNSEMNTSILKKLCPLSSEVNKLLETAMEKLNLTARGYYRIIKLARTIGDLDGAVEIKTSHIAEALQYRNKNSLCL